MAGGPSSSKDKSVKLQLTALVDVVSMILIFIVAGSFFGMQDLPFPENFSLPKSPSRESIDNAPYVLMSTEGVRFSLVDNQVFPIGEFLNSEEGSASLNKLETLSKQYIERLSAEQKKAGILLNVVADTRRPYREVFEVSKKFREYGFNTILFITQGEKR